MKTKQKCEICGRKKYTLWILRHLGYKDLIVCQECSECMKEQLGENIPVLDCGTLPLGIRITKLEKNENL